MRIGLLSSNSRGLSEARGIFPPMFIVLQYHVFNFKLFLSLNMTPGNTQKNI